MDIGSDTMVPTASAQVATPTVTQAPVMPTTVPISVSPGEKPERFSGLNFKRWQQKMLLYLTTLNLARFLTEEAPKLKEDERDIQVISVVDAWKHSDFLCRNYVMNALTDSPYNVYTNKKTAKELWESLDQNYKTEDAGAKKFVMGRFLDYKMVDSKTWSVKSKNFVEHGKGFKFKKGNNIGKGTKMGPKGGVFKKQKFIGKCFNYGKQGHKSSYCRLLKKNKLKEANVVDDLSKDVSEIDLTAVISEVNLVGSNPKEWWIDTGATRHVCSDKMMFSTFEPIERGEKVFMGNSATSDIKGQGKVVLKMTSGKELTLTNVLYVPEIRKNLVSGSLLNSYGFLLVFESDKFVLSKSGMYVGKGYMSGSMWKLNVMTIIKSDMNKVSFFAYILESSNLWHDRLGHVNYDTLRKLINLNHIPTFQIDAKHKCETCVEAKLTRLSFQNIERHTKPLDLIHSDICDLKLVQKKGGNKYFITFVDDSTKYCYVYLLKSKG